ncbi:DUF2863 family protein [Bordetella sp. 02P26C-1]|uniref:DUF2863 family protein n=1 Tax=Bordetella sp. 02P26C-1 TaxID=2683195 RepID=UPI0013529B7E|nr:DUF2863 family protein [Bordetella sp. 02P26C-1]MVW79787.1 DUF2863 family protein [Bordetella sp. 02P26C-1]
MVRVRSSVSTRLNRDATRLVSLALSLSRSGSRVEDVYWEKLLADTISKLLRNTQDATLEAALEHLAQQDIGAYEVLIEQAETLSESMQIEKAGQLHDVLLIVIPIAAWTRYTIPTGPLPESASQTLAAHLHGHVLAEGTQVAVMPQLVSIDQMPRTFSETWQWMQRLGHHALGLDAPKPAMNKADEPTNMLADTRYVVASVTTPAGAPIFRWQEAPGVEENSREACLAQWVAQAQPTIATLMPGCGIECLLPDAYYVSNREADRRVRPMSLRAAVTWLEGALDVSASELRAVVAGCGETRIEEYRVGFTVRNNNDVVYGCIWPVYGREDDTGEDDSQPGVVDQIAAHLKEYGVHEVRHIPGVLLPEFCEDCGAPAFPNPLGELVHAELPEDANSAPAKFH